MHAALFYEIGKLCLHKRKVKMFFPVKLSLLKIGFFYFLLTFNLKLVQAHIEPEFYSGSDILAESVKKLQNNVCTSIKTDKIK